MTVATRAEDAHRLLGPLLRDPQAADRLTHVRLLPRREATETDWPEWVPAPVREAYAAQGIGRPWAHQAVAADLAAHGRHVVVSTGTASGKSLVFQLAGVTAALEARGPRGQRGATTLYLAPTKALAHDQLSSLDALGLGVRAVTHDGDSSAEQREWAREHAEYLLTNPDMLHRSLLPGHARWAGFLGSLGLVVVDECHHYRGVFGAHVAAVLRRLRRICARYGATPTFVLASATVTEPGAAAARLTGLAVEEVTEDASPRGELALGLWQPPFVSSAGEHGAPVRRSATAEVADLMAGLVADGVRTLAFVRSRRGAETVALTAGRRLEELGAGTGSQVASYRGGYLPEERRALERALRSGHLRGLAATTALELGVDISGLDAVLLAGFPGTRAALWQQLGRAGREQQDALGVLVARDDPLDTYLVTHPEALVGAPVEATVLDPANPFVLEPHLCAAAAEAPLTEADLELFGSTSRDCVERLVRRGLLRRRPGGWYWTDRRRACDLADIRSSSGAAYQLVESRTGRVVGTVDAAAATATVHPGAVYLHRGETWLVQSLDLDERVAVLRREDLDYATFARTTTALSVVEEIRHQEWRRGRLAWGRVAVEQRVVSFLRRRVPGGEVLSEQPLDLPPRTLTTAAVWWTVSEAELDAAGLPLDVRPGAAHAAEHCAIGLLPLFATCDRWDIGGVSTVSHPDTGALTVFVYDGHPGGAGFAERGFLAAREWLGATHATIAACGCRDGCPSCIQSPKCGNQNSPLDKRGALALLQLLLGPADSAAPEGLTPRVPRAPGRAQPSVSPSAGGRAPRR